MSKNLHSKFWKEAFEALDKGIRAYLKKFPQSYITMNFWDNNLIKRNNRKFLPPNQDIGNKIYFPLHQIIIYLRVTTF